MVPEVSVVIPSYNHGPFVGEAIESVLGQTMEDLELVIVDDASQDNTADVIRQYARRDKRIRAFYHQENAGIVPTITEALAHTRGNYISILASDDMYMRDKFAKQLPVIKRPEHQDKILIAEGVHVDALGKVISPIFGPDGNPRNGDIFEPLLAALWLYISVQTMLFHRRCLEHTHFDDRLVLFCNEYKFAVDLAYRHHFLWMEDVVFQHRIHGDNLSCEWDMDVARHERALVAEDYLDIAKDRISVATRITLHQAVIHSAFIQQDVARMRRHVLELLKWVPDTLSHIQQRLQHGESLEALELNMTSDGSVSFSLGEIGVTAQALSECVALGNSA